MNATQRIRKFIKGLHLWGEARISPLQTKLSPRVCKATLPTMARSTEVCLAPVVLPKDTRLTMCVVAGPHYGYPIANLAESNAAHETGDIATYDPHYPDAPSGPLEYSWEYFEFPAPYDAIFQCGPYQPPGFSLPVAVDFHPTYEDTSRGAWHENAGFSRYVAYPEGPIHLTTNLSIQFSQVSYSHPPWRFVTIQSARHTGIDFMSRRTNF